MATAHPPKLVVGRGELLHHEPSLGENRESPLEAIRRFMVGDSASWNRPSWMRNQHPFEVQALNRLIKHVGQSCQRFNLVNRQ